MKNNIKEHSHILFHTLAIGCNHLNTHKMLKIANQYQHHISFTSQIDYVSHKYFFHVFLISQRIKNYLSVIQKIKLEFPNSIFIVIIENLTDIQDLIDSKELFFILNMECLEYSYHQLWRFLLIIGTKKFSLDNNHNIVSIADGLLSLSDETYQRNDKVYKLTRKEIAILKVLLEYRGETVSREILIERIWTAEKKIVTDRVIDTNIVALRKMFEDSGRTPKYIQTIFGQGYKLTL